MELTLILKKLIVEIRKLFILFKISFSKQNVFKLFPSNFPLKLSPPTFPSLSPNLVLLFIFQPSWQLISDFK